MKHMNVINASIIVIQILFAIITIIMLTAFAKNPADTVMMTNGLISILILVQLFTVNILINMYNKLGGRKR